MARVKVIDDDRLFVRLQRQVEKVDGTGVEVGFPEKVLGVQSPAGTSVAEYMTYLHEGIETRSGTKAWPFLNVALEEQDDKFAKLIGEEFARVEEGKSTVNAMYRKVGVVASNEVKKTIVRMREPGLEPETIADKGSSNPLVDLGIALNAVTWEVVE